MATVSGELSNLSCPLLWTVDFPGQDDGRVDHLMGRIVINDLPHTRTGVTIYAIRYTLGPSRNSGDFVLSGWLTW